VTSRNRRAKDVQRILVSLTACSAVTAAAAPSFAQTAKNPQSQLAYAVDSSNGRPYLYGTTRAGGNILQPPYYNTYSNYGTLFKIQTDGQGYALLHSFQINSDGNAPIGGMILDATSNVLYGITNGNYGTGGTNRPSTFYSLAVSAPNAYDAILQPNFTDATSNLTEVNGVFYGTAGYTIFSVSKGGSLLWTLPVVHGGFGALTYGVDLNGVGWLYGASQSGGTNATGYVFKVQLDGTNFTVMWNFDALNTSHSPADNTDGAYPGALTLVQGKLYGTAIGGGRYSYACSGITYTSGGNGTLFSVDQNTGAFTLLHTFTGSWDLAGNCPGTDDGALPEGQLLQAVDCLGNPVLYGTTAKGGWYGDYPLPYSSYHAWNYGTIYQITVNPFTYQEVRAFAGQSTTYSNGTTPQEGAAPYASLTQDPTSPTILYGTTSNGGRNNNGTVFAWDACNGNVRGPNSTFRWLYSF